MRKVFLSVLFLFLALAITTAHAKDIKLDDWFNNYYKHPIPQKFVKALNSTFEKGFHKDENGNPNLSSAVFFAQIVADNPDNIDEWLKKIGKLDSEEELFLQNILWFSRAKNAKKYLTENFTTKEPPSILELEPNTPAILDMNWSYFLATGKKEPIRNIIKALDLFEKGISIKDYKKTKQTDKDKKKLWLGLTFEAARWSLESNCQNHEIVLKYCKQFYDSEKLNKNESLWLGTILAKVAPEEYSIEFDEQNNVIIKKQKADDYVILLNYISYLEQYIGGYPPNIDSDEQLEQIKSKLNETINLADSFYHKDPNNPDLLWALGFINYMAHNIDIKGAAQKSEYYYKKALEKDPKHIQAHLDLAGLYVSSNRKLLPEAEKLFLKAKKLAAPELLSAADEGLMFTYMFMGDYKKAIEYCDLCLKAYPNSEKFKRIKAGLESGKFEYTFKPLKK